MDPAAEAVSQRIGQTLRDKWTLERLIGSGGMAAVYEARHRNGARAAVKLLHPEMSRREDVRERFRREGYAANKVAHPGAVQVLDDDIADDGSAFLVMELLEGESLAARANRLNGIELPELLAIMDQILDVLGAAHAQGIVHRDLKPDNIFLAHDGRVKLLDFGIARVTDAMPTSFKTKMGTALGTAPYMAPEQALGKLSEVDGRADLFSVGATMFRLIARRKIHEAPSDAELLVAMATKPAPSLASVAPHAPPHVALLVDRALAFLPERRYPDAATMQRDLRAVRAGSPPPHATEALAAGVNPWVTRPPRPPGVVAPTVAERLVAPVPTIQEARSAPLEVGFTSAPTSPDAPRSLAAALGVASTSPDPAHAPTIPVQMVPDLAGLPPGDRSVEALLAAGAAPPPIANEAPAGAISRRVLLILGGLIGLGVAAALTTWIATRGDAGASAGPSSSASAAASADPAASAAEAPALDPSAEAAGGPPAPGSHAAPKPAEPARPAAPPPAAPPPAKPPPHAGKPGEKPHGGGKKGAKHH